MYTGSFKNIIYKICLQNIYIWHKITYNSWYAIKRNQTKHYIYIYIYREREREMQNGFEYIYLKPIYIYIYIYIYIG